MDLAHSEKSRVSSPVDVTINSSLPRNSLAFAQQPPRRSNQGAFYFCLYYHSLILSHLAYTPGRRPLLLESSVDHSNLASVASSRRDASALCIAKFKHTARPRAEVPRSTSQHLTTEGRNTCFPPPSATLFNHPVLPTQSSRAGTG